MLPSNRLSTTAVTGNWLAPDDEITKPLIAKELGGVGLSDPSEGLQVKVWTATYDGTSVFVGADDVAPVAQFAEPNITEIDLAFDQNMRVQIAFVQDGLSRFWWFDTAVNDHVFTDYPSAGPMRVAMDDKRDMSNGQNDVILTYIRDGNLYFRAQRDRYTVEYLLASGVSGEIRRFGMSSRLRLQWELYTFVLVRTQKISVAGQPTIQMPGIASLTVPADESHVDFTVAAAPTSLIPANPAFQIPANPTLQVPE